MLKKRLAGNWKGGYGLEAGTCSRRNRLAAFRAILLMLVPKMFQKAALCKTGIRVCTRAAPATKPVVIKTEEWDCWGIRRHRHISDPGRRLSRICLTAAGQGFDLGSSEALTFLVLIPNVARDCLRCYRILA